MFDEKLIKNNDQWNVNIFCLNQCPLCIEVFNLTVSVPLVGQLSLSSPSFFWSKLSTFSSQVQWMSDNHGMSWVWYWQSLSWDFAEWKGWPKIALIRNGMYKEITLADRQWLLVNWSIVQVSESVCSLSTYESKGLLLVC